MRQIQVKLTKDLSNYNPSFREGSLVQIGLDSHTKWGYGSSGFVWGSIGEEIGAS